MASVAAGSVSCHARAASGSRSRCRPSAALLLFRAVPGLLLFRAIPPASCCPVPFPASGSSSNPC